MTNIALVALFVLGVILAPVLHRVACSCEIGHDGKAQSHSHHPAKHDSEHCPVCQLAFTPMTLGAPVAVPVVAGMVPERVFLAVRIPPRYVDHRLPFSCGPPV